MADRGRTPTREGSASTRSVPILALNGMGTFDWDLDRRRLRLDDSALAVLDLRADEFDERPEGLRARVPAAELRRMRDVISRAIRGGAPYYGTYFRVRQRDGRLSWAHTHGSIRRDTDGRPRHVHGIIRDATAELNESGRPRSMPSTRPLGSIVQNTIAALARAHTVRDVIEVLENNHNVKRLGTASMVLGLVETGRIRLAAASPSDRIAPGTEVTRIEERYPTNDAVRTRTPLFIESPEEFERGYPHLWRTFGAHGVMAAAFLPLIAQAHPIGVIGLHYHDRRSFSDGERNLLLALAGSIAQSLQRAMLYDEAKDLAQSLQHAMLPHSVPAVQGADLTVRYRSASLAREVGGDWYDLIPLPQGSYGAVIGDVQGHDTHAAAVMGQLRIVLRAYAAEGHTPATVVRRASAFLHELDTERFATCLYAEADLANGVIQVVRAGHLSPLLRLADGSCHRLDVPGGLPLGHSEEFGRPEYETSRLGLAPGQTLLLFTDGLVEQPGTDLDDGIAALAGQVSTGPDDLDELADDLCTVFDERAGEDDVALLLLRRHAREAARKAGDGGMRLCRDVARGDPDALIGARHMIRAAGCTAGVAERSDDIELVADELITNVLVHTEGAAAVTVRLLPADEPAPGAASRPPKTASRADVPGRYSGGARLRIEVADASSALPRRRDAGTSGVSGRGLLLVELLADLWGVEPRGGGKCVWSEFALPQGV